MLPEQNEFLETLYNTYFNTLILYATIGLKDKDIAQDVVQDTFHTALLHIDTVMAHENPGGWLMKTLKYKIQEHRRIRVRYISRLLSSDSDVSLEFYLSKKQAYQTFEVDDMLMMAEIKKMLTPEEFHLLKRFVFDDVSHLDIAKELGISVYASQKRLQRIREKLYEVFPERKRSRKNNL